MAEIKYLTIDGLNETIQKLYHLVNVEKVKNGEDLKAARAQGDLSENADYDAARDEQARIESDIKETEAILKSFRLINITTDELEKYVKKVSKEESAAALELKEKEEELARAKSEKAKLLATDALQKAEEDKKFLSYRLRYLQEAKIDTSNNNSSNLGKLVTIYFEDTGETEEYKIVGSLESNPLKGLISNESPVGEAVLNANVGDRLQIKSEADDYTFYVQVKKIK